MLVAFAGAALTLTCRASATQMDCAHHQRLCVRRAQEVHALPCHHHQPRRRDWQRPVCRPAQGAVCSLSAVMHGDTATRVHEGHVKRACVLVCDAPDPQDLPTRGRWRQRVLRHGACCVAREACVCSCSTPPHQVARASTSPVWRCTRPCHGFLPAQNLIPRWNRKVARARPTLSVGSEVVVEEIGHIPYK